MKLLHWYAEVNFQLQSPVFAAYCVNLSRKEAENDALKSTFWLCSQTASQ